MTGFILTLALILAALAAIFWPHLRRSTEGIGRGLEDDTPVQRWEAERARLIAAMRDNDLALAEGRLDPATRDATAERLAAEAERVLVRLRAARGELEPEARPAPPRAGRALNAVALGLAVAAGLGAAQLARWQDIDLTGSPHADGRVPLDAGAPVLTAELPPVIDGEGVPDIGAMVMQLETRVAAGGAAADEIKMLLRSYDTLGRMEDAAAVLDAALARFPDDPEFQLGWLRAVVTLSRDQDARRGVQVADRLIAAEPELLEARWYRSLLLVEDGRLQEARAELALMAPRLPEDSPAHRAVTGLIAELPQPPG